MTPSLPLALPLPPVAEGFAVDPGHTGACASLFAGELCASVWIDRRDRNAAGYDVIASDEPGRVEAVENIDEVFRHARCPALSDGAPVVVEGLFNGKNGSTSLELAETTGMLRVGLRRELGRVPTHRPRWSEWAPLVVPKGVRATTKSVAAHRVAWLRAQRLDPARLGALATNDHVLDALCLLAYGIIQRRNGK